MLATGLGAGHATFIKKWPFFSKQVVTVEDIACTWRTLSKDCQSPSVTMEVIPDNISKIYKTDTKNMSSSCIIYLSLTFPEV